MKQKKLATNIESQSKTQEQSAQSTYSHPKLHSTGESSIPHQSHDGQVYQIELEIQVDGLREAKAEIETQLQRYIKLYDDLYDYAPVGYCTIARDDGIILRANLAFAVLLGLQREDLVEKRFLSVVSEESRSLVSEVWANIFSTGGMNKRSCTVLLLRAWKEPFWVRIDATQDEGGQSCEMVMVDISENKKMERVLHQNEMELYATLQALSDGVLMLDNTSAVRMCNTQAEKILGLNAAQIIEQTPVELGWRIVYEDGRPIDEVFSSRNAKRSSILSPIEAVINASAEQPDTTIGLHKAPGAMRWINVQSRPLSLYGNSELRGTIIVLTDITERRLLVQALRECERQKQILEREYDQNLSQSSTNNDNVVPSPSASAPFKEADVPKTDYITISSATQGNIMLDARKDVLYLEGADDYTLFVTSVGKEYLTFGTLGKWEQRLFPQGFIRVHRSTIVNFHAIYSWHYENKNIVLNMRDGKQIRVSKSYKAYFLSYVR